jgi:hypothetical protein
MREKQAARISLDHPGNGPRTKDNTDGDGWRLEREFGKGGSGEFKPKKLAFNDGGNYGLAG